jgi:hypothetical protein
MKVFSKILIFSLVLITFLNCMSSLHQFSPSDTTGYYSYDSLKKVEARAEQFTILGFVKDTNYVDSALQDLLNKCVDGKLEGIGTTFKTRLGFFSWTNEVILMGYCVSIIQSPLAPTRFPK